MKSRYKESTIDRYTYVFNLHILPYFGKRPISGITPKDIRAWQTELIDCYTINKLALYSENTSISLTLHLGRDCRPINKQKKVRLNASIQTDLFYLFIVLLVKRKLFNNCSNLTWTYCSTTFTKSLAYLSYFFTLDFL